MTIASDLYELERLGRENLPYALSKCEEAIHRYLPHPDDLTYNIPVIENYEEKWI